MGAGRVARGPLVGLADVEQQRAALDERVRPEAASTSGTGVWGIVDGSSSVDSGDSGDVSTGRPAPAQAVNPPSRSDTSRKPWARSRLAASDDR